MSKLSVVIPALNAAATIRDTLNALRAQAGAPPFEIIVVDNGSVDDTPAIAEEFGVLLLREKTRGPAAARNCGLQTASGDIVLHLDADTVPSRRWVAELARAFDDPHVVIAAGNTMCYPPQTGAERFAQAMGLYDAERASSREPFPFAPSLNLAVRADAARRAGGWNTQLLTGEDVDFSYRMLRTFNTRIHYCERAVLYHHARADDDALRLQARSYGAGAADLYLLYPQEVKWDVRKTLHVVGLVAARTMLSFAARAGGTVGMVDSARMEFLAYQAMWTRNFWLGFAKRKLQTRGAKA
jgi:glycosyltransferase involved in cell wall biosynthesis